LKEDGFNSSFSGHSSETLLLFGRDRGVLDLLAKAAVETEGADLKRTVGDGAQEILPSDVVIVWVPPDADADRAAELVQAPAKQMRCPPKTVYVHASGTPREAWAVEASDHEFEVLPGSEDALRADFQRLARVLRCEPAPCLGPGSYFVSLTFPDVSEAMNSGEEWKPPPWAVQHKDQPLHSGFEMRVDLLRSPEDEAFVLSQLALVRRRSQGQPIIFTVRSRTQGGGFDDEEARIWMVMLTGLRFGVEYLDVEAGWSREGRHNFLVLARRMLRGVRVIGSYHEVQRPLSQVSDTELIALFHDCAQGPEGAVDIVKVVGKAESAQCSIRINQAALSVRPALPGSVASLIAICTTEAGRLSRALNVMLGPTPVAHPALPGKAAPGQLSAVEIEHIRQTLGLTPNPFAHAAGADAT